MPTTSFGIGIAPNCAVSVGTSSTWNSADDIIGNGTYPSTNALNFQFTSVFFDTGLANGRINTVHLRVSFSLGAISVGLTISGFGDPFDGHPNPSEADTPVTADQWSIDLTGDFVDNNVSSLSLADFAFIVQTSIPTAAGGALAITAYQIDVNYEQFGLISITPNHGNAGDPVVIKGTGFTSPSVEFDGVPADNIVYVDSTTITADVPAHAPGFVNVTLDNGGAGGISTLTNGFRYGSRIDSVSLSHGAPFGDSLVNITGSGFTSQTIVGILFDDEPATNIFTLNDSNVSCHTPAHALGSVFITIIFEDASTIISDIALFTYIVESFQLIIPVNGENEIIEWVEPVEADDEIVITSENEEDPLDLTTILTLELVLVDGGTPIPIIPIIQTENTLTFNVPDEDAGIYAIVGTLFSGSVILGFLQILIVGNASGIYTLVPNKTNDTIYNNSRDGTTQDVRIPNPKIRTGFIGQ